MKNRLDLEIHTDESLFDWICRQYEEVDIPREKWEEDPCIYSFMCDCILYIKKLRREEGL